MHNTKIGASCDSTGRRSKRKTTHSRVRLMKDIHKKPFRSRNPQNCPELTPREYLPALESERHYYFGERSQETLTDRAEHGDTTQDRALRLRLE